MIVCEVLFLLAFAVWAWIRAHNPSIVDQEKFMDYGFLNAILKTDSFPPNDMWLAGFSINYYYFGYILIAGVTALSGVATAVAFNLANVTLFALTALGVFGIVHNLITARLLAAGRTARAEARQATAARGSRLDRPRGRESYAPQVPQRRREQAIPATRPPQSRRQSSASATTPISGMPSRRSRIEPTESDFEEPTPEEQEQHIEAENNVDTMAQVAQEQAEAAHPARRRRSRKAVQLEQTTEPSSQDEAAPTGSALAASDEETVSEPAQTETADAAVTEAPQDSAVEEPPARPSRFRTRGMPEQRAPEPRPLPTAVAPPPSDPAYLPGGPGGEPKHVPAYLSPYIFALIAALMVVAMGNLTVAFATKDRPSSQSGQPFSPGNGFSFCFMCNRADGSYNWFAPSRIVSDFTTANGTKQTVGFETINEFPAFSFLLADLHPHVLALPLVLLAIAVGMAFIRRRVVRAEEWRDGIPPDLESWLSLILAGLIAGSLYTTNTWDFPTYLLVILLCLIIPYMAAGRRLALGWRWLRPVLVQLVILGVFTFLLFLPFQLTFKSLVGGDNTAAPNSVANIPIVGWVVQKLSQLVLVNTADKTILGFVVIFGIFLFALLVWLVYEFAIYLRRRQVAGTDTNRIMIGWGAFLLLTFLAAFLLKFPLLALLLPMIAVSFGLIWLEPRRTERNVALVLVGVAALIGLTIEVIFLRDNFQMRMNTLFKFYFQIWILWALPAAYGLWRVLYAALGDRPEQVQAQRAGIYVPRTGWKLAGMTLAPLWAFAFLFLVVSGSLYTVYGAAARQGIGRAPLQGLDGAAWMKTSIPDDYAAIQWLNANAGSNDRLMEGSAAEYDWAGRMASFTGIPSLVGWDNSHESLWRTNQPDARQQISDRRRVVNSIYQGIDPNGGTLTAPRLLELLKQYGVTYVVSGAIEHGIRENPNNNRPTENVTPYTDSLFKYALTPVFTSKDTTIYKVGETSANTGAVPPTPVPGAGTTPGTTPLPTQPQVDLTAAPKNLFDAAGAGANRGQFNLPRGITRDSAGNFYVADTQNLRIQKFDKDGNFVTMFGSRGTGDGQFSQLNDTGEGTGPGGLATDSQGNVYVADTWNHRIQKFDKDGKFLLAWGGFLSLGDPNTTPGADDTTKFYGPRGIAITPDDHIYVTDTGNKRVLIFDTSGKNIGQINSGLTPDKITLEVPLQPARRNERANRHRS